MNDIPSPAPMRRRRNTPPAPPGQPPVGAYPASGPLPVRRPVRTLPIEVVDDTADGAVPPSRPRRKAHASPSGFGRLPAAVRVVSLAVVLALFFTGVVLVTRSYLAQQEERRRLEAEAAERAQHPLYYADYILSYAQAQNLDPALVSAVILCESSFDPMAESRLGARGLMQLMEDTAAWVAHKLDEDDASYTFDRLYDPETSIRYGTWYLGYLNRRFDGDATKVVCAYHAGQGNVDSWLQNPQYSSDGVTLDVIPTSDTAAYASRVLKARDVYRKYYFPLPSAQEEAVQPSA